MRVGIFAVGVVLLALGVPYLYYGGWILSAVGVLLVVLGVVLPKPEEALRARYEAHLRAVMDRLDLVEVRQSQMEDHLREIGERLGVPAPTQRSRPPTPLFPVMPGPPSAPPAPMSPQAPTPTPVPEVAATPAPTPVPAPPTIPPPALARAGPPAAPAGISWAEQQLGEKWFLWIGLIVLATAFAFFLAIVLPRLTPEQIVAAVFASAVGLALLSEYIFARKGLRDYAKGLEAGTFGIAYIGVWGAGFFFRLEAFPWPLVLGAVLVLHAAAALRYRSPVLASQAGLIYLAWILWLRAAGQVAAVDAAVLLSVGGVAVLGLAFVQRDARSVLALAYAFDGVAVGAFPLLIPYGPLPALVLALVTAVVVLLPRAERILTLPAPHRVSTWAVGIGLAYGALIANALPILRRGGVDGAVILGTFAAATTAFTLGELLLRDRGRGLALASALAFLTFPVPFLLERGEFGLLLYPAVLAVLAAVRGTKGLAWFTNIPYLGLLGYAAVGPTVPEVRFASAWTLFFGLGALHAFLQVRSGHAGVPAEWPVDLPLLAYAVALVGLSARAIPGSWSIGVHVAAFTVAILLNHGALRGRPSVLASTIAAIGAAAAVARWWALRFLLAPVGVEDGRIVAGFHAAVFVALGAWVLHRRPVAAVSFAPARAAVAVSAPALALLTGLFAQGGSDASVLAVLPPVVAAIAYILDDPITFNVAYVLMAVQTTVAAASSLEDPADALPLLLAFAGGLLALGFGLDLWSSRRTIAGASEVTGALLWIPVAPAVFGVDVQTTVAWTIAGAVAVAWGLWRKVPYLRYVGFALFFSVLGKVFLYDIAGLELAVRVLALVVLAAALLGISYGYARYRKRHVAVG